MILKIESSKKNKILLLKNIQREENRSIN